MSKTAKYYVGLLFIFIGITPVFSHVTDTLKPVIDSPKITGDTVDARDDKNTEMLLESQTEDAEDSKLLDQILFLESNPIDINSANTNELQKIPYIDAIIATRILEYRTKNGKFLTIAELRYVDGIDDDVFDKVKKFVIVKNSKVDFVKDDFGVIQKIKDTKKGLLSNLTFEQRTRFSNDLEPSRGYLEAPPRLRRPPPVCSRP